MEIRKTTVKLQEDVSTVKNHGKTAQPTKVTSAMIGEGLSDMFIKNLKSPNDIKKIKDEFSITATNTEIYLCLSSLYFMSFIRATLSEDIQISQSIIEKISHSMASFLVAKYIIFHHVNEDVEVLLQEQNRTTQNLLKIWNESINKKPNPHWYVGKEACYILNGKDKTPNVALTTMLATTVSNDTILIKQFLDETGKEFNIIE